MDISRFPVDKNSLRQPSNIAPQRFITPASVQQIQNRDLPLLSLSRQNNQNPIPTQFTPLSYAPGAFAAYSRTYDSRYLSAMPSQQSASTQSPGYDSSVSLQGKKQMMAGVNLHPAGPQASGPVGNKKKESSGVRFVPGSKRGRPPKQTFQATRNVPHSYMGPEWKTLCEAMEETKKAPYNHAVIISSIQTGRIKQDFTSRQIDEEIERIAAEMKDSRITVDTLSEPAVVYIHGYRPGRTTVINRATAAATVINADRSIISSLSPSTQQRILACSPTANSKRRVSNESLLAPPNKAQCQAPDSDTQRFIKKLNDDIAGFNTWLATHINQSMINESEINKKTP